MNNVRAKAPALARRLQWSPLVPVRPTPRVALAALWVAQAVLSGFLAAAGAVKLAAPLADLASWFAWTRGTAAGVVRLAGALELVAALVVLVPPGSRAASILAAVAAGAVSVGTACAAFVHLLRDEVTASRATLALAVLAASVAWGRSREARRGETAGSPGVRERRRGGARLGSALVRAHRGEQPRGAAASPRAS